MGKPLKVLIVEDSEDDAVLVLRELERGGYDVTSERVETADAMISALENRRWDAIISDYRLPAFDAPAALAICRKTELDIPFIVVSGTVGEDIAVEMMRIGAHDYIMKGNLTRLPAAIERELREVESHRQKALAEGALRESEEKLRSLVEHAQDVIMMVDSEGVILFINRTVSGFLAEGVIGKKIYDYIPPEFSDDVRECVKRVMDTGESDDYETAGAGPDGATAHYATRVSPIMAEGKVVATTHICRDVTEQRLAKEALQESEAKFRSIFDKANDGMLLTDVESRRFALGNDVMCRMLGYNEKELCGLSISDIHPEKDLPFIMEQIEGQLSGETQVARELPMKRKDGSVFYADVNGSTMTFEGKTYAMGIFRDVTERKKAVRRIEDSESRLNFLVSSTPAIIYTSRAGGDYGATFISETVRSQLGYEPDAFLQDADFWATSIHPGDVQRVFEGLKSLGESGRHVHEYRFRHQNGAWRWLHDEIRLIRNDDGSPREIIGCMIDITERKESEEARKKLLLDMTERVKETNCLHDVSMLLAEPHTPVDEMLQEIVPLLPPGWQYPDITCARIVFEEREFATPNFKDTKWKQSADIIVSGEEVGFVEVCHLEERAELDEGPFSKEERGLLADLARQIGIAIERRVAEAKREESETRFKSIFDTANDGILLADVESRRFTAGNKAMCRMLGYDKKELLELSVGDIHPEGDMPFVVEQFERQMRKELDVAADLPVKRKDGSVFYADVNSSPVVLRGKTYLMGIFRDVTDRKQAQEELAAMARFPDEDPYPVMRVSSEGVVLYANEASAPLLDAWSTEEGKRLGTYWLTMVRQVFLSGSSEETEVEAGDRFFAVSYAPVIDGGYVNIYGLDITARKAAEEELRRTQSRIAQQERLRALGQMASGIAHDFNNALAPILGFSELALTHRHFLDDKVKMTHYLETIHTAAGDAAEVVRRLREFYRPESEADTLTNVDINALIVEVMMVTEPRWRQEAQAKGLHIDIDVQFGKLPPVPVNESQIRQVFINMIFNAVDAMPEGGIITFRTRAEEGFAIVEVADTGSGMSADTVKRCMEPFYTSKKERGTGLGLSIAHGVIQRHGGSIEVRSDEGKGTTFTMRLSLAPREELRTEKGDAPAMRRGLRVLVADDEPMVREVTEGYLVGDGHTVVTARDGAEALEIFRAGTFDLVVTDMAMPKLGGAELATAVKGLAPDVPVILLTGFGDMANDLTEEPLTVDCLISKPVKLDELRRVVTLAAAGRSDAEADRGKCVVKEVAE